MTRKHFAFCAKSYNRIIMILFYSEGYRIREISDILKIPESTVKTRLQRGREKLEVYYKEK